MEVIIMESLTANQKCKVRDILNEFQLTVTDLPVENYNVQHQIKLTTNELIRTKQYAVPYRIRESLKTDFSKLF